ncbi:MAG: HAMP domain-containing histidine kinase, partial [Ktedonobacterales bacterium]|nr:HAMP domain-containing histidine kinase [Ktedonobacterales bacterium]
SRLRVAGAEVATVLGWGTLLAVVMLIIAGILQGNSATPATTTVQQTALIQGFTFTVLAMLTLFRIGVRVWRWWDRLRRGSVSWALTHALLIAIAGVGLAFATLSVLLSLLFIPGYVLKVLPDAIFFLTVAVVAVSLLAAPVGLWAHLAARRITLRLRALAAATESLRRGDLSQRATIAGADEVAQLGRDFNAMAADLERAQAELRRERDTVVALLRARRELVAAVSHDLRTPVASQRAYVEGLLARWQTQPPATTTSDLATLHRETLHLQGLVADLFALARADVGKLALHLEPTDVGLVCTRVVAALAPYAWESGRVTVSAPVAPSLPLLLLDPQRLEQILHNLVGNAIRHTPPGGVVLVTAECSGTEVSVIVRDTGPGISPADLPHIFDRFYGGGATGGAGLGLTLVREWTSALGGTVAAANAPEGGACFTLRFPGGTVPQVPTP